MKPYPKCKTCNSSQYIIVETDGKWYCSKCKKEIKRVDFFQKKNGYKSKTQEKNLAWFLPRPKKDKYKGGMPLYCEEWLVQLSKDILGKQPDENLNLLNLFCGMNKIGVKVDVRKNVKPDFVCDAHKISALFDYKFEVILADPPYSDDESKVLYGTGKLNYKKWTTECEKILKEGGLLVVYHKYVMPNPNPDVFEVVKRVFIGNRTFHSPRVAIFFRKKKEVKT